MNWKYLKSVSQIYPNAQLALKFHERNVQNALKFGTAIGIIKINNYLNTN